MVFSKEKEFDVCAAMTLLLSGRIMARDEDEAKRRFREILKHPENMQPFMRAIETVISAIPVKKKEPINPGGGKHYLGGELHTPFPEE